MLCFVVVMQSFIMNSHEVFIHIHQGCFAGIGAIFRLPQCQWSKPDGYGKISQCITTTKHSKAKTMCIFLGIYCIPRGYVTGNWEPCPNARKWSWMVWVKILPALSQFKDCLPRCGNFYYKYKTMGIPILVNILMLRRPSDLRKLLPASLCFSFYYL